MNTPDQAPKNGDFVAYLAELERRQSQSNAPPVPPGPKMPAKSGRNSPLTGTEGFGSAPAPGNLSPDAAVRLVRSLPVGLIVVGFVLLVAGLAIDGGGFLILIGVLMLVQAVRSVIKAAKEQAASPAQQVAALLSAHLQAKTRQK